MPCRTEEPTADEMRRAGHPTHADFEAVMCGLFCHLEKDGMLGATLDLINWTEAGVPRSLVEKWWSLHQERDRQRREAEAKAREQAEARERAELARLMAKYGVEQPLNQQG